MQVVKKSIRKYYSDSKAIEKPFNLNTGGNPKPRIKACAKTRPNQKIREKHSANKLLEL